LLFVLEKKTFRNKLDHPGRPEWAEFIIACDYFKMIPIKCPGAPQKIMYLAEHYFRKVYLKPKNILLLFYISSSSQFVS
jgi:hypothetical protein